MNVGERLVADCAGKASPFCRWPSGVQKRKGHSVGRLATVHAVLFCVLLAGLARVCTAQGGGGSYDSQLEEAVALYADEDDRQAAAMLDRLTKQEPDRKEAFLWLGYARERLQQWEAARTAYKRYTELAPKDVEGPWGAARTYAGEGNKELGKLWYKNALDIEPDNEEIKRELDALERGMYGPPPDEVKPPGPKPPEPKTSPEPENGKGFWDQGVLGLIGARKVWWGMTIGVGLFVLSLIGAIQHSVLYCSKQFGSEGAPAAAFFVYFIGQGVWWVILWGVPSGGWWVLMLGVLFAGGLIAGGATKATVG